MSREGKKGFSTKGMKMSVSGARLRGRGDLQWRQFMGDVLVCLPNLKCRLHLMGLFLLIMKLVVNLLFRSLIRYSNMVFNGPRQQESAGE